MLVYGSVHMNCLVAWEVPETSQAAISVPTCGQNAAFWPHVGQFCFSFEVFWCVHISYFYGKILLGILRTYASLDQALHICQQALVRPESGAFFYPLESPNDAFKGIETKERFIWSVHLKKLSKNRYAYAYARFGCWVGARTHPSCRACSICRHKPSITWCSGHASRLSSCELVGQLQVPDQHFLCTLGPI